MSRYSIAVIPGDGIGSEVTDAALTVLQATARTRGFQLDTVTFPWSSAYYLEHGSMMPPDGLEQLRPFDAIYLGAVGWPEKVPDHITLHGLLLEIRRGFQQFINMRPSRLLPGIQGPLRAAHFDILSIRENSEGEYVGAGGRAHAGTADEVAIETSIFTRVGVERVMRFAFEQARSRRGHVAAATKSNALRHSMVFWDEVFAQVSEDYPDVPARKYHIDALAARFITHPESLDVVVASNLFGDILTDIGAAIMGGLGFAASGNIDPTRTYPSMFEAVHGSAPDIAGQGIANPVAAIWAGAMMLEFLGEREGAAAVMRALGEITDAGVRATPDMGGTASTSDVAGAVAARVLRG